MKNGKCMFRHYEIVLMIYFNKSMYVSDIINYYSKFVNNCGKIYRIENWGVRSLSYSINKNNKAHYILMNIKIDSNKINIFTNDLKLNNKILRYLVIRKKKAEINSSIMKNSNKIIK